MSKYWNIFPPIKFALLFITDDLIENVLKLQEDHFLQRSSIYGNTDMSSFTTNSTVSQ